VSTPLPIGDFSRASHLSVKTLRHYHRIGLLEPAEVDPETGYRRYRTEQIPVAQIIRRFRDLEMPLEEIHAVLSASDVAARNQLIESHPAATRVEPRAHPGSHRVTTRAAGGTPARRPSRP
jgi:DNA-binding transcriptional MerR regulator